MRHAISAELLGLLLDAEWTARENRRLTQRLREAQFPKQAVVEAIDSVVSLVLALGTLEVGDPEGNPGKVEWMTGFC